MDLLTNYKSDLTALKTKRAIKALEILDQKGLPNKKWEEWKYTQIQSFLPKNISNLIPPSKAIINQELIDRIQQKIKNIGAPYKHIVIYNGVLINQISNALTQVDFKQVKIKDLEENSLSIFTQLNHAQCSTKDVITLKKDQKIDPIIIFNFSEHTKSQSAQHTQLEIKAESASSSTIIEYFLGLDNIQEKTLRNHKTTCHLLENSRVDHIKIIQETQNLCHISETFSEVEKSAYFFDFTLPLSSRITRCGFNSKLTKVGAHCTSNGLFSLYGKQHFDIFSKIDHLTENTTSSQLFKGVLRDESHGVFTGKVLIGRNANGSYSEQLNKNLLIGEKAQINTRPQLEVYSDDVQCTHGATTGNLGDEEIFYLQSRGIKKESAYKMLTEGFIKEVISTNQSETLKNFLIKLVKSEAVHE